MPTKEDVIKILRAEISEKYPDSDHSTLQTHADEEPASKKKRSIFDVLNNFEPTGLDIAASCMQEVDEYLKLSTARKEELPLEWWRTMEKKFPRISKLAAIYLSFPASSGGVERLFSVAGAIGRSRRARLTVLNMEKLLVCQDHLIQTLGLDPD